MHLSIMQRILRLALAGGLSTTFLAVSGNACIWSTSLTSSADASNVYATSTVSDSGTYVDTEVYIWNPSNTTSAYGDSGSPTYQHASASTYMAFGSTTGTYSTIGLYDNGNGIQMPEKTGTVVIGVSAQITRNRMLEAPACTPRTVPTMAQTRRPAARRKAMLIEPRVLPVTLTTYSNSPVA